MSKLTHALSLIGLALFATSARAQAGGPTADWRVIQAIPAWDTEIAYDAMHTTAGAGNVDTWFRITLQSPRAMSMAHGAIVRSWKEHDLVDCSGNRSMTHELVAYGPSGDPVAQFSADPTDSWSVATPGSINASMVQDVCAAVAHS